MLRSGGEFLKDEKELFIFKTKIPDGNSKVFLGPGWWGGGFGYLWKRCQQEIYISFPLAILKENSRIGVSWNR